MFDTLKKLVPHDRDFPLRAHVIEWREEFRTSAIYDRLKHEFHAEKQESGEYVPLSQRKPSVSYGLPMIIVNDTTSLLFSEGHFPAVECGMVGAADEAMGANPEPSLSEPVENMFADLVKETKLRVIMLDGAVRGSVGSICFWLRVLKGRIFIKPLSTRFLTPEWDEEEPDKLVKVVEKYKVKGKALRDRGYPIDEKDDKRDFWFQREWNRLAEVWYLPWPVQQIKAEQDAKLYPDPLTVDTDKTKQHNLGFVPMEWVKNLPGGDDIDGVCTFEAALKNSIEIDYQLSQAGRGLKYSSDPTLHIKDPAYAEFAGGQSIIRSADNALVTSKDGDVRILEISGTAAAAVVSYVSFLRELSLELCGGNRSSPEKLSGAQSGRAMELMNQALIWLADKLRTSYGEGALMGLLKMVLAANQAMDLVIGGQRYNKGTLPNPETAKLTLKWPPWYQPTAADHQAQATSIKTYRDASVLSRETAIRHIQHDFDIEDPMAEIERIDEDADADAERQIELTKATQPPQPQQPAGPKAVKEAA